ncbi:MAG: hypothetical protein H6697_05675 [Myxococcales bacterium]|nr:hypothetical protein [Myxococcales bacterium]MCB9519274.1 hypothetical protein [Myxococcales bacterium]
MRARIALVGLLTAGSASARAELLVFELDGVDAPRIASSWEAFQATVAAAGVTVQWADQLFHDPNYSPAGGASYGTMAVTAGTQAFNLTWFHFDTVAGADASVATLQAAGPVAYPFAMVHDGPYLVTAYSDAATAADCESLLERLTR